MPAVVVEDITVLPRIAGARSSGRSPAPGPQRDVGAAAVSRGRGSRSGVPSPASTWRTSTRSSTSTRWARWTTPRASRRARRGIPHRGFETVTYMIDGVFEHADSNGGGGVITNGDTQWMTAGAGILHIEKPPEWLVVSGGLFHGLQLWVNLPACAEADRTSLPGPARERGRSRLVARRWRARPRHRRRRRLAMRDLARPIRR